MRMPHCEKIQIDASPERIWACYANVGAWNSWDREVKEAYLDNGLQLPSEGFLVPRKGPKAKIRVVKCKPNGHFTIQSKLPLCAMNFEHYIFNLAGKSVVEHRIIFNGVLAPLFSLLVGRQIYKALPGTLASLKKAVEGN